MELRSMGYPPLMTRYIGIIGLEGKSPQSIDCKMFICKVLIFIDLACNSCVLRAFQSDEAPLPPSPQYIGIIGLARKSCQSIEPKIVKCKVLIACYLTIEMSQFRDRVMPKYSKVISYGDSFIRSS